MNLQIHARNVEVNDQLRDYVEKKLSKLDRYLPYILDVRVDISYDHRHEEGNRSTAQLTVRDSRGTIIRAEEKKGVDAFSAVDAAMEKLYRQISRYKDKRQRHAGRNTDQLEPGWADVEIPPIPKSAVQDSDDSTEAIVRRKQINVTPMSEQEAIDQMELLGHKFFVFYNMNSATINVLYRRDNGDYGILEPTLG